MITIATSLESASREWRNGLIDVGGNNRLLNYRNGSSTLVLDAAPPTALAKLLAGASVRLSELFPAADALQKAQKACTLLARKQLEAVEEYGISVTYLAAGMASWNPEGNEALAAAEAEELGTAPADTTSAGSADAAARRPRYTRPRSPVLLRPIQIELHRGAQQAWDLQLLDDFQVNGVLTHVMNADRTRIDDDHILEDDRDDLDSITEMQVAVEDACTDVAEFEIEATLLVGAFSYAKQPMVEDVSDLDALEESDLIAALAGDAAAVQRVKAIADDVTEALPDYQPVDSEFLVVDADASQSYVVNAALARRNMVVEGPPGTGKSQTIANIIAASAAAGRRVLFVAQKRAAVSAVLSRLEAADLDHIVLDVFAAASSRRFVADQLQIALERQASAGPARTDELHFSLTQARDQLVRHNAAMHDPSRGWGVSVAELIQLSLQVPAHIQSTLRIPAATLARWTALDALRFKSAISELAETGALDTGWATVSGWSPSAITTDELLRESNKLLVAASARLPSVTAALAAMAVQVQLIPPNTWGDWDQLFADWQEAELVQGNAGALLDPNLTEAQIADALWVSSRNYRRATGRKLPRSARREASQLAKSAAGHIPRKQRADTIGAALNLRSHWKGTSRFRAPSSWRELAAVVIEFREQLSALDRYLHAMSLSSSPIAEVGPQLARLTGDQRRPMMPRVRRLTDELAAAGLEAVVADIAGDMAIDRDHSDQAALVLDRVVTSSLLEDAFLFDAALAGVVGRDLNRSTAAFQRDDLSHLQANSVRIRRIVAERLKEALDDFPDQHVILKKEVTRKTKFTPVRRLLRELPEVIFAAKPVWAMSPLQVSRLLPREQIFDVVIFDEASQVKPSDAIPAILRGAQLIVAGDSRQLPPTEFFTKTLEDSDDDDIIEDADLETKIDSPVAPRQLGSLTRDAESILFAMDRMLAGQSRRLLWHYRSRDERLIAVSNRHVYDGSLTTFPAADTPDAVEHVVVPNSKGIGGGTNSPEAEVAAVVAAVKNHALIHPDESLGVISFGIKHQHRLEAALDQAFADDPDLFQTLNRTEPFFVKSIERVQGDERDAIILTVGYGKTSDGQLRLFWGPLLQAGGERRLNVAISRAKLRMTLISSFSADDLAADGHDSRGYQLMYHFVRFMASRGQDLDAGPNRDIALNPFEIDVRDRLEAAGIHLDAQVGVGSYRLDFAARHPTKPGRHVLAIEADGAAYHSGHTARERDRLRQQLLERRGWTFHRIWSTDWFNNADAEVAAVRAAFDTAVLRADSIASPPVADLPTAWELPVGVRQLARPSYSPGRPIDDYPMTTLVNVLNWIRSDSVVRSSDDELAVMLGELGFQRRGVKIVRRITEAQLRADQII